LKTILHSLLLTILAVLTGATHYERRFWRDLWK